MLMTCSNNFTRSSHFNVNHHFIVDNHYANECVCVCVCVYQFVELINDPKINKTMMI